MNKKIKLLSLIDEVLNSLNLIGDVSYKEKIFLNKFVEYIKIIKKKIENDEIELSKKAYMIGIFRWFGEYDNLVNRYKDLYYKLHEIEMFFK